MIGTGLDVWELLELLRAHDGSDAKVHEHHPRVGEQQLRLALSYAQRFPEEIERFAEAAHRPLGDLVTLYPFLQTGGT